MEMAQAVIFTLWSFSLTLKQDIKAHGQMTKELSYAKN